MREISQRQTAKAHGVDVIPVWGANAEKQLGDGPFVAGAKSNVVDIKLYMMMRWILSGAIDHVPPTVLDACPKLIELHGDLAKHPGARLVGQAEKRLAGF